MGNDLDESRDVPAWVWLVSGALLGGALVCMVAAEWCTR